MEYLEFSGKKYVKVSSAARETGYTSDYIGQLCRARKIDAKLVGRTWYVAQDEIHSHRRSKGRSARTKVHEDVKQQIAQTNEETTIPVRVSHIPARHKRLLEADVRYHSDETELIPLAQRASHIDVVSSDTEKSVSISTDEHHVSVDASSEPSKPAAFTPAEKHEIKWNGTIVVEPLEKPEIESTGHAHTTPLERHVHVRSENERNIKPNLVISDVSHDPLETKKRFLERMNLAHELNTENVTPRADALRTRVGGTDEDSHKPAPLRTSAKRSPERIAAPMPERAVESPVTASTRAPARLLGLSSASIALVSLGFFLVSAFVQTETEYRAPSGAGAKAVFYSNLRFSTPSQALDLLSDRLNEAMTIIADSVPD